MQVIANGVKPTLTISKGLIRGRNKALGKAEHNRYTLGNETFALGSKTMDGCNGLPQQYGYRKACPIRNDCMRYKLHLSSDRPNGYEEIHPPYDFEDRECGKFLEQ